MRALTKDESELIEKRKASIEIFLSEMYPVLVGFLKDLDAVNPHLVLQDPALFLDFLDEWLLQQDITSKNRVWIHARLNYYIGEYFVQKYSGEWLVNEIPDSMFFGRYVIGKLENTNNPNSMIDPFEISKFYLDNHPRISLTDTLREAELELANLK